MDQPKEEDKDKQDPNNGMLLCEGNPVEEEMKNQDLKQEEEDLVDDLLKDRLTSVSNLKALSLPSNISGRTYISELHKQLQEER